MRTASCYWRRPGADTLPQTTARRAAAHIGRAGRPHEPQCWRRAHHKHAHEPADFFSSVLVGALGRVASPPSDPDPYPGTTGTTPPTHSPARRDPLRDDRTDSKYRANRAAKTRPELGLCIRAYAPSCCVEAWRFCPSRNSGRTEHESNIPRVRLTGARSLKYCHQIRCNAAAQMQRPRP